MPTPSLPVEIHGLIIDIIGDEHNVDVNHPQSHQHQLRCMEYLRTCALVCKRWHIYTLPYIFGSVDLARYSNHYETLTPQNQLERLERLLQVLEPKPFIGRYVRSLSVFANGHLPEFHDALGKLVSYIQLVTMLTISYRFPSSPPDLLPFFDNNPSLFPQLQHITLWRAEDFKTSSLRVSSNLKSITFYEPDQIITDHGEDFHNHASLQKLVLDSSDSVMTKMQMDARFRGLFRNVQHFDMALSRPIIDVERPYWQGTLNWENLRSLSLSSGWLGLPLDGSAMSCFMAGLPWSSFALLATFKFELKFNPRSVQNPPPLTTRWFDLPTPLLLSEASRLVRLREVTINYRFLTPFRTEAWLERTLGELYGECINPSFGERGAFPALEWFSTSITINGTEPEILEKRGILDRVRDHLPSIFYPASDSRWATGHQSQKDNNICTDGQSPSVMVDATAIIRTSRVV